MCSSLFLTLRSAAFVYTSFPVPPHSVRDSETRHTPLCGLLTTPETAPPPGSALSVLRLVFTALWQKAIDHASKWLPAHGTDLSCNQLQVGRMRDHPLQRRGERAAEMGVPGNGHAGLFFKKIGLFTQGKKTHVMVSLSQVSFVRLTLTECL